MTSLFLRAFALVLTSLALAAPSALAATGGVWPSAGGVAPAAGQVSRTPHASAPAAGHGTPRSSIRSAAVPGPVATVDAAGMAHPPASAPASVKRAIWAGNAIQRKPYVWGGGHASWKARGYDCSGSVSYVLHAGGLLESPLVSGAFARWGASGPGRWITVYANGGHAFVFLAGLRLDTSGSGGRGPRWRLEPRWTRGFAARHPAGL